MTPLSTFPRTVTALQSSPYLLYEVVSGSHAYGLATPQSDLDLRGVFILPNEIILSGQYVEQMADEKNDLLYYEIGRFLHLLERNNPNILELIYMPEDCIRFKNPLMDFILARKEDFLTKICRDSFGGYATQQIKKARGLNKKIVNPIAEKRLTPLDYCWILPIGGYDTLPAREWLANENKSVDQCGLIKLDNARDLFVLFYDESGKIGYRGIADEDSNDVRLSSIPKGETPVAYLIYNADGYSVYCKKYREYFEWKEHRNEARYQTNAEHGLGYDSKNMMHCIRLLKMAHEIATDKSIHVRREDRDYLLQIRQGKYAYDDILSVAEALDSGLREAYNQSILPEKVDSSLCPTLLLQIRQQFSRA